MNITILGAGPTGLGAAHRLDNYSDYQVFERNSHVGGLSSSFVDDLGFTWDVGGHVLFSHFHLFDNVLEKILKDNFLQHQRECWVRILKTWVPYPFQNNIRYLPEESREFCLEGLRKLTDSPGLLHNFKEWMNAVFGEGIVKYFMEPYNFKVWATPPELMSKDWIAERVSVVDLARIERNIVEVRDDIAWGPNNLFKFPQDGGTGSIYQGISKKISAEIKFNHELVEINLDKKTILCGNGASSSYDKLISTIPLDQLIAKCFDVPVKVLGAARELVHNSVYVVGIGIKGERDDSKCWMYFPEDNCPFYRVTNFHNYSPNNVPNGDVGKYFSLMCETSYSKYKTVSESGIVEETIQGLINSGMINNSDRKNIVSRYLIDVPYAYPVPTLSRDSALEIIQSFLEEKGVFSRGRFGSWKYEIGNMDHSFMQGVEVVERIINGTKEKVFNGE